jgi:anti-anti-sigma regulatory factor
MLAKRTASKLGGELQLVAHSPAVLEVFELLNVAAFFGDHLVIPPSTPA